MAKLLAVLALVALPVAGAMQVVVPSYEASVEPGEVDTTLYFHLVNVQDMPLNTQRPSYDRPLDGQGYGPWAATLRCIDPYTADVAGTGVGTRGTTSQAFYTYRAFSSPSYVEYDAASPDGGVRVHPERGLGYDIPLNRTAPVTLHWFMAESQTADNAQAAPLANVAVHVEVREADAISVDDKAYDTGAVIMSGATQPVSALGGQLTGPGTAQVSVSSVDGRWVYGFAVPLAVNADALNRTTGYTVRIDVAMDVPACPDAQDGSLMAGPIAPYADPQHEPRLLLRNGKPLHVEWVTSGTEGNGTIGLAWSVSSGWGNYDVAVADATLELFGPRGQVPVELVSVVQRYQEVYHHTEPYKATWNATGLPDGTYTAIFSVPNLQRTATAEARAIVHVEDGRVVTLPPQEAPAPPPVAMGFAILAAALLARRRA